MKIRTYGVSKDTVNDICNTVFTDLYLKVKEHTQSDVMAEMMIDVMEAYPQQCKTLIISSIVFAIGNFDRIEKLERWAEVSEDGKIDNDSLEEVEPGFII